MLWYLPHFILLKGETKMAYDKGNRPEGGFKRRGGGRRRKKVCVFCGKENNEALTVAIKRARHIALMPYVQD